MEHSFRDMSTTKKRSIQDIKKPDIRGTRVSGIQVNRTKKNNTENTEKTNNNRNNENKSSFLLWFGALGVVVFLLFALSFLFSGASVMVMPTQTLITIDDGFTANKNATDNELLFNLVVIKDTATREIETTGRQVVETKASGLITVYNTYSSNSQRLIRNTRFETPDGKIYRIADSITVPGVSTKDGEKIPGSIEVRVFADVPGASHNIGLSDFTIPGFKGGPRFAGFYARSKTPMEGGFSGEVNIASEKDIALARIEMQEELKARLLKSALAQVPENFILYEDAVFFEFEQQKGVTTTTEDNFSLTEEGELHAAIFDKQKLSTHIAKKHLPEYDGSLITVSNIEKLVFRITDKDSVDLREKESFDFSLFGVARLVWEIDIDTLKTNLAGTSRFEFDEIVKKNKSINKIEATIRPFWVNSFPEETENISVIIQNSKKKE